MHAWSHTCMLTHLRHTYMLTGLRHTYTLSGFKHTCMLGCSKHTYRHAYMLTSRIQGLGPIPHEKRSVFDHQFNFLRFVRGGTSRSLARRQTCMYVCLSSRRILSIYVCMYVCLGPPEVPRLTNLQNWIGDQILNVFREESDPTPGCAKLVCKYVCMYVCLRP